ncbi:MAG: cytochrome C [Deltaproteobacteria bacterium]|nr:cytochrome C [Deltaproteobacteria bacterium]
MYCKIKYLLVAVGFVMFFSRSTLFAAESALNEKLDNRDCVKCHISVVQDIKNSGARHLTDVTCLDCHQEHPPAGTNAIPLCSQCHDPQVKKHFTVDNCIACHYPHYPLRMDISSVKADLKTVCLSCHQQQGDELTKYPSKHSDMSCAQCHPKHATFKDCLACHQGHGDVKMTYQDCLRCHQPHMPAVVRYDTSIPSSYCGSCHNKESGMLAENHTKHHDLSCVYCHKNQHKVVPECEICHGQPHGEGMHKKFPNCIDCHVDAHALFKD